MSSLFRFPKCAKAEYNTASTQVVKVLEETYELVEVQNADPFNSERIIEEAWDVIHAAEGVLRKYSTESVAAGLYRVEEKNKNRGYYGE